MKQCVKVPFCQICFIWVCAKWVPKLWILSEKVRILTKKWPKSERAKSEWTKSEWAKSEQLSSNHRELHGAIFFIKTPVLYARCGLFPGERICLNLSCFQHWLLRDWNWICARLKNSPSKLVLSGWSRPSDEHEFTWCWFGKWRIKKASKVAQFAAAW